MNIKIEHIAIWTNQLEKMKSFYVETFSGRANSKYMNAVKGFESYFITFEGGARIELMSKLGLAENQAGDQVGIAHIAFCVGNKEDVDHMTNALNLNGVAIISEPRWTGDGYYESIIGDPDGNAIELVAESKI